MKSAILITSMLFLCSVAGTATAKESCDDVKAKIVAKLESKGVKKYSLEVVPKDQATDLRVVGTCDGGTKKIIYKRE
jgi:Protein of unknown function (DUF1161)